MQGLVGERAKEWLGGLLQLVCPSQCLICSRPIAESNLEAQPPLCSICLSQILDDANERCPRCAAVVGPHSSVKRGCPSCRNKRFAFTRALCLGAYEGRLRDVVLGMKYHHGEIHAEWMGRILVRHRQSVLEALRPEVLVPVPLHWWRRWRRGYNQSGAVARGMASRLGVPCASWVRRIRSTPFQSHQTWANRRENVAGAFRAHERARLRGRRILVVDDVMTSGATSHEVAKVLKDAGASEVMVAVLARAGAVPLGAGNPGA